MPNGVAPANDDSYEKSVEVLNLGGDKTALADDSFEKEVIVENSAAI